MSGRNRWEDSENVLEQENARLRRALDELDVLEEIAAATVADRPMDSILELIVEKCTACLDAEQGSVHLVEDDGAKGQPLRTLLRHVETNVRSTPYRLADQLAGWMLTHKAPLRINDPGADKRIRVPSFAAETLKSLLSVPLLSKGELLGVLTVFNKTDGQEFNDADERVLSIIAALSAQVLRAAELIGGLKQDRDVLASENSQLWRQVKKQFSTESVIGSSAKLREVLKTIEQIRDTSVDVLITGESGTGKDLIAKTIHFTSPRARKPFVALNCAALPETLLESELFGIEKGVATGVEKRLGQFEAAHEGTLFLDEIGDLSLTAQAKILRVLQERIVQRVGGREQIPIDVRILAATNKDLRTAVKEQRFREDLYFRLNVIHIRTPSLREIRDDIAELAHFFLGRYCEEFKKPVMTFAPEALAMLTAAPWPGNVRQMQNEVKRLVICAAGTVISVTDLREEMRGVADETGPEESGDRSTIDRAMDLHEKRILIDALKNHNGNQVQTAKTLGLSRQGLIKKMKRLGIQASKMRESSVP